MLRFLLIVVLCGLGWWQVERLQWKNDIITKLHNNQATPITDTSANYELVSFAGEYDFANELHLIPRTWRGQMGYHVITPLQLANSNKIVLVNRGWSNEKTHTEQYVNGAGVVRQTDSKNLFTPDNDLTKKTLYYVDIAQITHHLKKLPQYKDKQFLNFYLIYKNPNFVGKPVPYDMLINLRNNHLGYAITWFGLAFFIFFLWMRKKYLHYL